MGSPILEFAIQQSEQLRAHAAELLRKREELSNILSALAGAQQAERDARRVHENNLEALARAEAQGTLDGGKAPAAERKAFTASRDALDFTAARCTGLEGLRGPAELAVVQAENVYDLAEKNWARAVVTEFVDRTYLPAASEFLKVVNAGLAIACNVPEPGRLYTGLTGVRLPVLGRRELQASFPDNNKQIWKNDPDALQIARVLSEIRGRQAQAAEVGG